MKLFDKKEKSPGEILGEALKIIVLQSPAFRKWQDECDVAFFQAFPAAAVKSEGTATLVVNDTVLDVSKPVTCAVDLRYWVKDSVVKTWFKVFTVTVSVKNEE